MRLRAAFTAGTTAVLVVLAGTIAVGIPAEAGGVGAAKPGAPVHVRTSNATQTSLEVSWVAPYADGGAAISDYAIEYRKVGTLAWVPVAHETPVTTSITVAGLTGNSTYAVRVAAVNAEGTGPWNSREVTLDGGESHTCAVIATGRVSCWGYNNMGQLGNNSTDESLTPTLVSVIDGSTAATTAIGVTVGYWHSCAVLATGRVMCWGWGGLGQLGTGGTADSLVPAFVDGIDGLTPDSTAVSLAAGSSHSCALMANGIVKCWGATYAGQLGEGTYDPVIRQLAPAQVSEIDGRTAATTAIAATVCTGVRGRSAPHPTWRHPELGSGSEIEVHHDVRTSPWWVEVRREGSLSSRCAFHDESHR